MLFTEFPHVASALQHENKIILSSNELLIIHCTVSNVFVAECSPGLETLLAEILKKLPVVRLQTSNQKLQQILIPNFKVNYKCCQAVFKNTSAPTIRLEKIKDSDLDFVGQTYEMPEYICQLFKRNRIFGFYENQTLIGYVAFHIDETVGALYVKPEFRGKGYGALIMQAGFSLYARENPQKVVFAQILSDNFSSIKLHQKLGCDFSVPVYWVYNQEYIYQE